MSVGQSLVENLRRLESSHLDLSHSDDAILIFSFGHGDRFGGFCYSLEKSNSLYLFYASLKNKYVRSLRAPPRDPAKTKNSFTGETSRVRALIAP